MAGYGFLGAAGASQAGVEGAGLLEQVLNRRRLTGIQEQELGLKKQQSDLNRASTLATLGLTDQAADILGVSRGELEDPIYKDIAVKLFAQRLAPPADLQSGIARELFPPPEIAPDTRLGRAYSRVTGGQGQQAPPTESPGGPTLGLNPRLSLSDARASTPTGGPATQVGTNDRLGIAMKILTAGKENPQLTHPLEVMAYKYATEGESAGPIAKQAWDTLVASKGTSFESLKLKLEATQQKMENDLAELQLKIRKLEEVDKPKVALEAEDVGTRKRVAATGEQRARTEQQKVEQGAVEIERKAQADFEREISNIHAQFGSEQRTTTSDEPAQTALKERTRLKIRQLFDREIERRRAAGVPEADLKKLEQHKLDAMAPYRPALTGPGRIQVR